jgi:nucleoside-diphosphate-sugar epimerase
MEQEVGQFLFVSTCVVHDKILNDRLLDEAHPLWTSSTYGAYKAAIEAFIPAYHAKYGINASAWRPSEVYGIRRRLEDSNWYDVIQAVKRGERLEEPYGGKIVAVEDIASAIVAALGRGDVAGEVFNLTDCHIYRQDVAEYAREITGSDSEIANVKGSGPKHQIVTQKAQGLGLFKPRGHEGVKAHIRRILES